MSHDEIRQRLEQSRSVLDQAKDWLEVTMTERIQEGVTGRVNVEFIQDEGYIVKARGTQEVCFE